MAAGIQQQTIRPVAGGPQGIRRAVRKTLRKPQFWFGACTLVPLLAWYGTFALWSIARAVWLAFIRYRLLNPTHSPFAGFTNFQNLFADALFWQTLGNSVVWGILGLIGIPIALGIAVCLASVRRGRTLYQTLIFVPVVLSLVSLIVLVRYLLDPQIGPIDQILNLVGLPTSQFLNSSNSALPTLVGFAIWKGMGINIVILTAGLLNIPQELLEAAQIDGAGGWKRFRRITLPLVQPTLNLVLVLGVIGALQEYTIPRVMTSQGLGQPGGGPDNSTYLLNMYIYDTGLGNLQFGQATAAALVEFALTLFLTLVVLRALRLKWSY